MLKRYLLRNTLLLSLRMEPVVKAHSRINGFRLLVALL